MGEAVDCIRVAGTTVDGVRSVVLILSAVIQIAALERNEKAELLHCPICGNLRRPSKAAWFHALTLALTPYPPQQT